MSIFCWIFCSVGGKSTAQKLWFFNRNFWLAFTFLTDVRSSAGTKLETLKSYHGLVDSNFDSRVDLFCRESKFLPTRSKIFLWKVKFFYFFFKTFLTVIANLLNSGNKERRLDKNQQDRKSLLFSKPLLVANLFWNEFSKTFLSHQYHSFIKSQLAFNFQIVKTIEGAFFQKTRFHLFERHLYQYSEVQKNPAFAGRLVFFC